MGNSDQKQPEGMSWAEWKIGIAKRKAEDQNAANAARKARQPKPPDDVSPGPIHGKAAEGVAAEEFVEWTVDDL